MTKFHIDKQTLHDLSVFDGHQQEKSIFNLFKTISFKGKEKLIDIFNHPTTDIAVIEGRKSAISHIEQHAIGFLIDKDDLDFIEYYLNQGNKPVHISSYKAWENGLLNYLKPSNDYYIIQRGVLMAIKQLTQLYEMALAQQTQVMPPLLATFNSTILDTLSRPDFVQVLKLGKKKKLSAVDIHYGDHLFRYSGYACLLQILDIIYQLDVLQAVAFTAKRLQFCYPVFNQAATVNIQLEGLFHPFIDKPVLNTVTLSPDQQVCFLTGSNMAGKSTLLKAMGICVYLAHLGFPVPAAAMETSLLNGLFTTLNLSDDVSSGYSHFYREVKRVKDVAEKLNETSRLLVIFDELFRGTNVKDASDASIAIIKAFTTVKDSCFIISTHIVEVAHELKNNARIDFKYMETLMKENVPTFSYHLKSGITEERIGLWIIENEHIIDIIMKKARLADAGSHIPSGDHYFKAN